MQAFKIYKRQMRIRNILLYLYTLINIPKNQLPAAKETVKKIIQILKSRNLKIQFCDSNEEKKLLNGIF